MEDLVKSLSEWLKHLGLIQACLMGTGVLIGLFVLWNWLKRPSIADVVKIEAARGAARGLCAWVSSCGGRLFKALKYLFTRREWRYEQPWMLLLGELSSGKTSLLRSVSSSIRQTPPARVVDLQAHGTEWFFFRKGVLIDPEGKYSAAGEGSANACHWDRCLDEIKALRPERPLDGLVLCLSARTLMMDGLEVREALAAGIYHQLARLQERIEFMLPLTVVVTQCDCVDGFDAFWHSQNKTRRLELFGYSAPSQAQSYAPADWADEAFNVLGERLRALQIEAAASKDKVENTDGFFLFPNHFERLHIPLRGVLEIVFRASAWQAGYLFRGLFFTGSPEALGELREGPREDVAFVDALLSARVLAEPGLARPTRNGIFSRNKLIRGVQFGAIVLILGLFVALFFTAHRVAEQVEALVSAQIQLQRTTPQAVRSGDCLQEESVYPLLTEVSRIDHNTFYWALPASWLDRRVIKLSNADIENHAINKVLIPSLACLLEKRARELSTTRLRLPVDGEEGAFTASRALLAERLDGVIELEDNIARFDRLVLHGDELERAEILSDLAGLSKYLFDAELPPEVMHERGALSDGFASLSSQEKLNLPPRMREDLSGQIKGILRQLRTNLHGEVMRGAALIEQLVRAEPPVLGNTRRFGEWFEWTEKSWMMSTPATNPCEDIQLFATPRLAQLVSLRTYDSSVMHELSRFDTNNCYRTEMAALEQMGQAQHGAIFIPRKPYGLMMTDGLRDDLVGMPALLKLGFMRLGKTRRFACLAGGEGFRQAELAEATGYLKEYEDFIARMKLKSKADNPLYAKLARLSLANALDDALERSQIAVKPTGFDPVSLEAVMPAEQRLSTMSKELSGGLANLLSVLRVHGDYGDASTTLVLRQCARDFASDGLSRVSALAEASRLYQPAAAVSGERLYDLGSLPVQKEYLSRQVARAQILANYATPFVNLLSGSVGASDTRWEPNSTSTYWRNSIDELSRYLQGKEPVGQVANLDNYFIRQLGSLDYGACHKQLVSYQSPEAGNDLFSERRSSLESLVSKRCDNRHEAQAMETYGVLARRFNRELAGHYPFADSTAPDARVATVRQFFADYLGQRSALEEALAGLKGERWQEVRQFMGQLDAVAEFFRTNLLAGEGDTGKPIRLHLVFNAPRRPSHGSEQIVSWLLSSGSHAAGIPNRASVLDWQVGESLVLDLSWANRSEWSPLADSAQADLIVEGNTASFAASSPWALLRMIARHRVAEAADPDRGLTLGFAVPQQREILPGKSERDRARLYLGMSLAGADPKTQAETALRLPGVFPRNAPSK